MLVWSSVLRVSLVVALMASLAQAGEAKQKSVFLKVGSLYVLYTHPVCPYLDKYGRLMTTARPLFEILGGRVFSDPGGGRVKISLDGHDIVLRAGLKSVQVDKVPVAIPVAPKLLYPSREMLIPLASVLRAVRISASWDDKTCLYTINEDVIKTSRVGERLYYFGEHVMRYESNALDTSSLLLTKLSMTELSQRGAVKTYALTYELQNATAQDMKVFQNIFVMRNDGADQERGIPFAGYAVPADRIKVGTRYYGRVAYAGSSQETPDFVLLWPRILP